MTTLRKYLTISAIVVLALAGIKLLLHLLTAGNYGLFIDELYFLAAGQNLAWGYVDMPPLTAFLSWLAPLFFGNSTAGIHVIPALLGAGLVIITGWLVAELGGKVFAQALAGVCVISAGIFLTAYSYLSMNAVEPLLWVGCAALLARMIRTGNTRLWIGFGILAGIGLMNKNTMLMFGAAVLAGLLLTQTRKLMFNRWFVIGGVIALLIFMPNLVWMVQHNFPMLELLRNIRESGRNVTLNPLQFLLDEIIFLHPLTLPVWLGGLGWYFFNPEGKRYRCLGWTFLFVLAILLATEGRTYYLAPAFPLLFAAGGVWLEHELVGKLTWLKPAYLVILVIGGLVTAPLFLPVLSPEAYIRYTEMLRLRQPKIETFQESALPQLFADRFGWPEMAEAAAEAHQSLPPEERAKAVILTGNYGQAGAIDFYGPELGLPKAISGHQNYFYWGLRGYSGEVVIGIGMRPEALRQYYGDVDYAGQTYHRYAMAYENAPIYIARHPKVPLQEVWENFKNWR